MTHLLQQRRPLEVYVKSTTYKDKTTRKFFIRRLSSVVEQLICNQFEFWENLYGRIENLGWVAKSGSKRGDFWGDFGGKGAA